MPKLGSESLRQLATCDPRLQRLAAKAITYVDFAVLEGHRNKAAQNAAFAKRASQLKWPNGNHNGIPSRAFDFAPWPIDWDEHVKALSRFTFIAGVFRVVAVDMDIKIRFGWDWNRNLDPRDENFMDWGHVELDQQ